MYINSLVNSKNRLLARFPIYQKCGYGDRNISTVKNYTSGTRLQLGRCCERKFPMF